MTVVDDDGAEYDFDQGAFTLVHYDLWSRCAPDKMTVGHWRKRRFSRVVQDVYAKVHLNDGREAADHCTLGALRAMAPVHYVRPMWPNVQPIYFKYICPAAAVAYRLNEELQEAEYTSKTKIDEGWIFKHYEVVGMLPETRIFPWEYVEWHDAMSRRAQKFSSTLDVSFYARYYE